MKSTLPMAGLLLLLALFAFVQQVQPLSIDPGKYTSPTAPLDGAIN